MSRQPGKKLLKRIASGDKDACAVLIDQHHEDVFRFCLHLARDVHAAEDLTQETFASFWQSLATIQKPSSLKAWLHRIAYNKFVDWRRRQRREVTSDAGQAEANMSAPTQDTLGTIITDERNSRLYEAIGKLDEDTRLTVVLHYLQGLSFRQMADVLSQPTGTVKWRVSKALGELRRLLAGEEPDETK